jgi:serine/threonine protein kinase
MLMFHRPPARIHRQSAFGNKKGRLLGKDWVLGVVGHKRSSPVNYQIVREVARGGMSVVYEATRKTDNARVAIKVITPEFTQLAVQLDEAFDKGSEGEIALTLRHPNVIRTLDYGHKGREYYIVMEFIDGPNLKQLIDQHSPRCSEHDLRISIQIARGLSYIHKHGLVHRDFCPKNILLAEDGTPKIIDFGLAIPAQLKDKWRYDRSGTAAYMAPEQVRGQKVDARTDVYGFSVSVFEILTGTRPFPDDPDKYRKLAIHLNRDPVNPRDRNRNISVALEHVLLRGMAREREDRYPTVDDMLKDVYAVAAIFGAESRLPPAE